MQHTSLNSVSPIDGRYQSKTADLAPYFSEWALIKYRLFIEIKYFEALYNIPLKQLSSFPKEHLSTMMNWFNEFSLEDGEKIKEIESVTNHDVKAVEYFIKQKMEEHNLSEFSEWVHFGLTSQDINNTAVPISIRDFLNDKYFPLLQNIIDQITSLAFEWRDQPMLARTHGQPASPTRLGKEFMVFTERLKRQLSSLKSTPNSVKFGGATGNMNAHYVAFPTIDWHHFADNFVEKELGMLRSFPTTQIEHYDNLASIFDCCKRINTILIDFCRDIWTYISMDYFKQKINKNEVGSSAMPHKVNPIDFENAEGNLGLANAIFQHLSSKLPVSRLQRDLTDSTVSRNIGVPFAHTQISLKAISKGLNKLLLNKSKLDEDLEHNWAVVAEAIQNILRREGFPKPYEALKSLTRNNDIITEDSIKAFIENLDIDVKIKEELNEITPFNYLGK